MNLVTARGFQAGLALLLLLTSGPLAAQRLVEWTEQAGELGLGYPVPIPVDTPLPFDGFRTYTGLHTRHQNLLTTSDRVSGSIVGQTRFGRDIWAYRLAAPGNTTPEGQERAAIFYAGTLHAREWQSPEVVTGLMERIVDGQGDDYLTDYVADHVNIVVVPVTNIDGFLQTQANPTRNWMGTDNRDPETWPRDGRMRRKNLRNADQDFFSTGDHLNGVDLNRNNPPFWPGPPETGISQDLTYRGPSPQSEPEIQALISAADLGPGNRLRFFADMHSYSRVFFSVFTSNSRRNAIQTRLFSTLRSHHAALPGNKFYMDIQENINVGIGTTSEYFGHTYQVPSMTWEIEPGQLSGAEYGGFGSNGHDGFILPESEIRRVRENLAETMLVAAYHMAGPPHLQRAEIRDAVNDAIIWSARWDRPVDDQREQISRSVQALSPGRDYRLWLGFSKPMRWREEGEVAPFPGQSAGTLNVAIWLEADEQMMEMESGDPVWLDQPGGAPSGFYRYRDDALSLNFRIADTSANQTLIGTLADPSDGVRLSVLTTDLTGHRLDADPSSVADYVNGAWSGYDSRFSEVVDFGGTDRSLAVPVTLEDSADPLTIRPGHSALWFNPDRSGEGWVLEILPDGQALGYWFTYDEDGNPRWLIGQGPIVGNEIQFNDLLAPVGGRFGPDFDPAEVERVRVGSARVVLSDCDNGWFEYDAYGQSQTIDLVRLSRTQGLDCPDPLPPVNAHAGQSGTWFDPSHDGEGYTVQWLDDSQVLVMWFSYDPEGNQYWMLGMGSLEDGRIVMPEVLATRGATFGEAFDPDAVERFEWGAIEMSLDCLSGSADYQSVLPAFGSGSFELDRLTFLAGLDCED